MVHVSGSQPQTLGGRSCSMHLTGRRACGRPPGGTGLRRGAAFGVLQGCDRAHLESPPLSLKPSGGSCDDGVEMAHPDRLAGLGRSEPRRTLSSGTQAAGTPSTTSTSRSVRPYSPAAAVVDGHRRAAPPAAAPRSKCRESGFTELPDRRIDAAARRRHGPTWDRPLRMRPVRLDAPSAPSAVIAVRHDLAVDTRFAHPDER